MTNTLFELYRDLEESLNAIHLPTRKEHTSPYGIAVDADRFLDEILGTTSKKNYGGNKYELSLQLTSKGFDIFVNHQKAFAKDNDMDFVEPAPREYTEGFNIKTWGIYPGLEVMCLIPKPDDPDWEDK